MKISFRHPAHVTVVSRLLALFPAALPSLLLSLFLSSFLAFFIGTGCRPTGGKANVSTQAGGPDSAASGIRLVDVTKRAGIVWQRCNGAFGKKWMPETKGGGAAFIDYDNDGYPDIVMVNGDWWPGHELSGPHPTLVLYHNNHDGTFTDVTHAMGLDVSMQGMGVAVGDYDNDGYDDLLITGYGGNHLFHNERGKRFVDVTRGSGVAGDGWSTSAAWIDVDNDGRLDLFVCHYAHWTPQTDQYCGANVKIYCTPEAYPGESCRLYHNDGGGHFTDITRKAGLYDAGAKALGVLTCDIDGDGRTDLVVSNDLVANFAYHNNGDGSFRSIGMSSGLALSDAGAARAGMGIDVGDVHNNGTPAILIGNFSQQGAGLYEPTAPGLYADVARDAGVLLPSLPYVTFGALFCDLDNDGWKDIVLANGHVDDLIETSSPTQRYRQPPLILRNRGDGAFTDITAQLGPDVNTPMAGRGLAWGDFDNDGRVDLLIVSNIGLPRLLHNETPAPGHWVTLAFVGVRSNRDGYGARVRVTAGGLTQTDTVRSGSSYCSQSDRRLHFGLGRATRVDRVEIDWPSGQKDVLGPLVADRIWTLTEGHSP